MCIKSSVLIEHECIVLSNSVNNAAIGGISEAFEGNLVSLGEGLPLSMVQTHFATPLWLWISMYLVQALIQGSKNDKRFKSQTKSPSISLNSPIEKRPLRQPYKAGWVEH